MELNFELKVFQYMSYQVMKLFIIIIFMSTERFRLEKVSGGMEK